MFLKRSIFFVFCIITYTNFIFCSGDLDVTFGTGGIATTSIGRRDFITSSTIQVDGKVVVTGVTEINNILRLVTARYLTTGASSGSLDTTFNATGFRITLIGSRTEGNAVTLQSDSKIVSGGFAYQNQTNFVLVRYNTDGTLDTTFNGIGSVTTSINSGAAINSVKIQTDGKIVAAGSSVNGQPVFTLARYNTDGSLDASFGSSGIVTTQIGVNDVINQIALQGDGKIIAAGYTNNGSNMGFALARYNTNGSLDATFGSSGIVMTYIEELAEAQAVELQTDGKIVVGGYTFNAGQKINKFVVARYDSSGTLDSTFNGNGIAITMIQNDAKANAVILQTDGKIIAGGYSSGDTAIQFALARYLTNGDLDATYGSGGIALTTIGGVGSISSINSLVIQADDKCVASGFSEDDFALARYTA